MTVKVKPLVWASCKFSGQPAFYADTEFGAWMVVAYIGRGGNWAHTDPAGADSDDDWARVDDAKAAAQADYESRVLAALEAPPDETAALRAKLAEVERAAYERGAEAGWNAARTSVYGICEAIEDRANTDLEKPQVSEYGTGYLQAEKSTAKHIRRAMGSFEAKDDDNFLALLTQEGR